MEVLQQPDNAAVGNEQRKGKGNIYLIYMASFILTVNSATQGYDSSMMNGLQILPSYVDYFQLTTSTSALNVAIVFVGSIVAMPFAGPLSDKWGRKWGIAIASIIAIVGAVIQSAAVHVAMFCIGRMIIGFFSHRWLCCCPDLHFRGRAPPAPCYDDWAFGTSWYVGSLVAAGVTYGSQYIESTWSWRLPSLLQLLHSVLCLAPLPFIPESPRWLIYKNRQIAIEYQEICQTLEHEKSVQKTSFKTLFSTRPNLFSQVSGNNITTYYLGDVLTSAGITEVQTQLGINLGLSGFNLVCATAGSWLTERIGRRPGFLCSTGIMSVVLIIVSVLTKLYGDSPDTAVSAAQVTLIFIFYGSYSFVWTPLTIIYTAEVLSYSMRANGLAFYNGLCYGTGAFNTYTIPYAMQWSSWGFYMITALWCFFVELPIIHTYFPATERKSLEEIDVV
ncbi:unnamed protein product [Clonostachys rhizophaga]|uniref:Major facilitator superfamily (MFS) profile domain-containing protein n=1 Tax=Clonostachys rhizophaga TaxID=160324 RepID=A0A9N9VY68_9HYPO|nr:unnamed protein product [Clonostachys rhizophaga]